MAIVAIVIAVIALVIAVLALTSDDDEATPASTTEQPTTTTPEPSTTTTTSAVDSTSAMFPDVTTSRRFDDPVAVTRAFVTEVLGFRAPILSEFLGGDNRSGEVEVRGFPDGDPTTVRVRLLEDDTWYVLGAIAESIRLDAPAAGAQVSSPLTLQGAARAFEGTVVVHLLADGIDEPIGTSFVTGRGDGELGEFSGSITFEVPSGAQSGTLVLFEPSAEDGSTVAAVAIRVQL